MLLPMDAWIVVLGAVGIGQILMLLIVFAGGSPRPPAVLWLSLFLISIGASLAADIIDSLGLSVSFVSILPLLTAALLLIGPALWLYTCGLTERNGVTGTALIWHFLPFALLAGMLYLAFWAVPEAELAAALDPELDQNRDAEEWLWLAPIAAQILAYLAMVARRIHHTRLRLSDEFSNLEQRTLSWILLLCALVGGVLAAWVLSWRISYRTSNLVTTVCIVLAISLIGNRGLRQANIFQKRPPPPPLPDSNSVSATPTEAPNTAADQATLERSPLPGESSDRSKYSRAALSGAQAARLAQQLKEIMAQEKPYLEEDLTLSELAARIDASPHQLSQLLNQHLGESFYDYVNRHRIAAFQREVLMPGNARRPLLHVALDCGFGSKSTFNAVFKHQMGMSPSAWRQRATRSVPSAQIQRHE